jgi:hypothetical protein
VCACGACWGNNLKVKEIFIYKNIEKGIIKERNDNRNKNNFTKKDNNIGVGKK